MAWPQTYQYQYQFINSNYQCRPRDPMEQKAERDLYRLEEQMEGELWRLQDLMGRFAYPDYQYNDLYHRYKYEIEKAYHRRKDEIMSEFRYYNRDYDYRLNNPIYYLPQTQLLLENKMPTETKAFIIISSAGAAKKPVQHKTLAEAETEATRLAKEFPKQEFTVYETKKSFKVEDKPITVKTYV